MHWYHDKFKSGMTDNELKKALEDALGIFGGSGGPEIDCLFPTKEQAFASGVAGIQSITLKKNRLFSGAATIAMAREVYGII